MATVKYRIREFIPTDKQQGQHSVYAEAVTDNIITNQELAKKIEARTGIRGYEAKAVLEAAAEIILEETRENNRVQLEASDGGALVSIYPRVSGSVTDEQVKTLTKGQRTVATADDLTADMLKWTLGATVGIKYSQQFALQKKAQRVSYKGEAADTDNTDNTDTGTDTGGNTGGNSGDDGGGIVGG